MEKLILYLQYPFVRYALIVGILIALCSSLLGVTLVLKRFSFIGDGLSRVAFGAIAIASVLKLSNKMFIILPVTVISAILLLRTGKNARIKGDAAIAMISVAALAFGYLIMNIFSTSSNLTGDVCSTLFGSTSILTLTLSEVWICAVLSVIVVLIFILFYNRIFAVTFDEDFAKATGTKAEAYNLMIAIVIAVIIVLAMNLVGSLLISVSGYDIPDDILNLVLRNLCIKAAVTDHFTIFKLSICNLFFINVSEEIILCPCRRKLNNFAFLLFGNIHSNSASGQHTQRHTDAKHYPDLFSHNHPP